MAMTQPQINLCETYLSNGNNALDAYFAAFPNADKTNRRPSYPYTLLKKPEIKEYIEKRRGEIYDSLNIDANRIANEIASIAFAEKGDDIYTVNAKLKALELLQKQFGLQNQKIETKQEVIEVSLVGD